MGAHVLQEENGNDANEDTETLNQHTQRSVLRMKQEAETFPGRLLVGLGTEADPRPVVHIWQEGVVVCVPRRRAYKSVLVHWLGVAERHPLGIDVLHHL